MIYLDELENIVEAWEDSCSVLSTSVQLFNQPLPFQTPEFVYSGLEAGTWELGSISGLETGLELGIVFLLLLFGWLVDFVCLSCHCMKVELWFNKHSKTNFLFGFIYLFLSGGFVELLRTTHVPEFAFCRVVEIERVDGVKDGGPLFSNQGRVASSGGYGALTSLQSATA